MSKYQLLVKKNLCHTFLADVQVPNIGFKKNVCHTFSKNVLVLIISFKKKCQCAIFLQKMSLRYLHSKPAGGMNSLTNVYVNFLPFFNINAINFLKNVLVSFIFEIYLWCDASFQRFFFW